MQRDGRAFLCKLMGFVNPSARPAASSNNNVPILFIVAAVILIIVVVFLACMYCSSLPLDRRTASTEMRPRGGERMSKWFV